jgi:hypothetical protein
VRLIDPTCGSGHFLLGGFRRLYELHARGEPGTNPRELAQRALEQVHGVDVNPNALNVDGYDVLTLDEESDTVVLNLELLRMQFEIG